MKLLERVRGTAGIKIVVGSGFFWAWLDALFMSAFFVRPESFGLMSELAPVSVFALSTFGFLVALRKPAAVNRLLAGKRLILGAAALGSIGSLLFLLAGMHMEWAALAAGGVCGGAFMAVFQMGWGAVYCRDGARSATPFVAGGFACAVIIDTPLLFMIPEASAVFYALLPLASGAVLATIDPASRIYARPRDEVSGIPPARKRGLRVRVKTHLGTSMALLCAVMLVMVGFGYMQHLVSFSSFTGVEASGILVQVVRGVVSVAMFALIVMASRRASTVYRVGLLAMIAGFMMMPFLFGTPLFWISGAIIISGYTALDLLIWVAFSQIAHAQAREPLKTIAVMRLLSVVCTVAGFAVGIVLVGSGQLEGGFVSAETTVMGYLVVIATVLMLSSEDIWVLFGRAPLAADADPRGSSAQLDERLGALGLTAREREIAALLAYGRTQPWIAERLGISENTVGTHVSHIYQKADVHDRQQFIDEVFPLVKNPSPDSRDELDDLTEVA